MSNYSIWHKRKLIFEFLDMFICNECDAKERRTRPMVGEGPWHEHTHPVIKIRPPLISVENENMENRLRLMEANVERRLAALEASVDRRLTNMESTLEAILKYLSHSKLRLGTEKEKTDEGLNESHLIG